MIGNTTLSGSNTCGAWPWRLIDSVPSVPRVVDEPSAARSCTTVSNQLRLPLLRRNARICTSILGDQEDGNARELYRLHPLQRNDWRCTWQCRRHRESVVPQHRTHAWVRETQRSDCLTEWQLVQCSQWCHDVEAHAWFRSRVVRVRINTIACVREVFLVRAVQVRHGPLKNRKTDM